MNKDQLTLGSLFDGIGGFPYAASFYGIRALWASEIVPECVSVTKKHFPEMEHVGDITKLDGGKLPPVDIITFGSPCQDLSVASGKRLGLAGERSGLFLEAIRIIREMQEATNGEYPKFALWENVPGALSSSGRRDFKAVLEAFAETEVERHIPTPAEHKAAHGYNGHDISRCYGIWQESSVIHILEDERYTGTYIMGKREVTEVGGHRVRMKDESQWIKIPDHHPAIISKELFDQVQAQRPRFKCPKKNARAYPLRGKVFCGCCRHAMPRTANRNHYFLCRHSKVNEAAPCHGLTVVEAELERMLYEILSKQAQVILNVADLANAGQLDIQLAKQAEYDKQIEGYLDQKRVLYEQLILKQITMEDYKIQKATVDSELDRLREIHSNLKAQTAQMEMDEKTKSARTELAQEVVGAGGLTAGLADTLIDRVYVYPNNQVEIVWKMKDFCMEAA